MDPQYLIDMFTQECYNYFKYCDFGPIDVTFDIQDKRWGYCVNEKLSLNWEVWEHLGPVQQELLVYHELGHCFLGLGHEDMSIMSYPLLNEYEYGANREKYLDKLFNTVIM